MKEQELKRYHLLYVQMLYADHYTLRAPVRFYHTKFKSVPSEMFSGELVFIDHSSGCVSIKHQMTINDTENTKSKLMFDRKAQS